MTGLESSLATSLREGSPLAFGLVALSGALASCGPCTAPRLLLVGALTQNARSPWRTVLAFVGGIATIYAAFGFVSGFAGVALGLTGYTYGFVASALAASGMWTLLRTHPERHAPLNPARSSGAYLLGAASAWVVSPCCTPFVTAIVSHALFIGRPAFGAALLLAFTVGHAAPLFAAAAGARRLTAFGERLAARDVPAIAGGTISLTLALYYGVLA